jgi:glycerol-3-phosphate dehydrogenase
VFPWQGKVLAGSTEIPLADPDAAVCTPEEKQYILDSLGELFPGRSVDPASVVSTFSGVRPLIAGKGEASNSMSRSHSAATVSVPGSRLSIYSMAGGKWTTFRSFSEEMADTVLGVLSRERKVSTEELPIGGGRDYPKDAAARKAWLEALSDTTGLAADRVAELFERYGTTAAALAADLGRDSDTPLAHCPGYSAEEIAWIVRNEKVRRLEDLVLRRTNLALLGAVSMPLLDELSRLCAADLGLSEAEREASVSATAELLAQRYSINL